MSQRFDCSDPAQLAEGLQEAQAALRRGQLVVMPTDTLYGIAAEAFDPVAVDRLLAAKGQGRDMPPPVMVGTVRAAIALVQELSEIGKDLIDEFWPGPLTLIFRSSPTLVWDIGETQGTVGVRMPLHHVALGLLKKTGPLVVTSARVCRRGGRADQRRSGGGAARRKRGGLPGRRALHRRCAVHHRGPDRVGAEAAPARRHPARPAPRGRPAGGRRRVRARSWRAPRSGHYRRAGHPGQRRGFFGHRRGFFGERRGFFGERTG